MSTIEDLIRRSDKLKQDRKIWDQNIGAPIAEIIRPLRNELRGPIQADTRRDRGVYDGTAIMANQNLAAGLYGTFVNPSDMWFQYSPLDDELASRVRVKHWCEIETRRTLKSATPAFSEFYSQVVSYFLDLGAFGNAVFSSELNSDMTGYIDVCRPLSECCWDVDGNNRVNAVYRRWMMPARAAVLEYGEKLSAKTRNLAEKEPDRPVDLLHAVMPAGDSLAREAFKSNMPIVSIYVEVEHKHQISKGGYWDFPYDIARWEVAAGEKMGRGCGELSLGDAKTANVATRDNIKAGNRAADPPWGAPDEGVISAIRVAPGKISYGAVNQQGKQLLMPLLNGANLPWSIEMADKIKEAVKDFFYFSVLQLVGRTGMTATEVLEVREERLRLLAPYGGRIQNDFLCPWSLRRFNMHKRLGLISPPPPELVNRSIQVAFTSPFALAQKSAAANSTLRTIGAAGEIAKFDPDVLDRLDGDISLQVIQEGFGAPAKILRTDEATAQRRAQRQQAQAAAASAAIADTGAGAAEKGAGALAKLRQAAQQNAA